MMIAIEEEQQALNAMSTAELFVLALTQELDSEKYLDTLWTLYKRANTETFEMARSLCASEEWLQRTLGVNVLAQLGAGQSAELPFLEEALPLLIAMAEDAKNLVHDDLLCAIIAALGCQHDDRAIPTMIRFVAHPNPHLRFSLAIALGGRETDIAIKTLIRLSQDTEGEVRDYATFGLGTMTDRNTKAIREALAARLDDEHDNTRNEAIFGLAKRHDERAIAPLIRELEGDSPQRLTSEAAALFPDARLLPVLLHNKKLDIEFGETDEELDRAIELCQIAAGRAVES